MGLKLYLYLQGVIVYHLYYLVHILDVCVEQFIYLIQIIITCKR